MLWLSIWECQNDVFRESVAQSVIRIISVLNAYYGDNAYCVRIKGVKQKNYSLFHSCAWPINRHSRWAGFSLLMTNTISLQISG